jgi:uncharacterized surface protein with fasciclin (FAS1) repeats
MFHIRHLAGSGQYHSSTATNMNMSIRSGYQGILVAFLLLLVSCKKEYNEFYARPDNLEQPIFQQLSSNGKFKSLTTLIEKAGYKETLSNAGYWTLFAPHDSAFAVYFKEKGLSGADAVDADLARQIVTYCLVYNAFKQERISDYQSNLGWVENGSFRRRTAAYTGVYSTTDLQGKTIKAIASNRNNTGSLFYVDGDNNNKHIPIFETGFMTGKTLTASDYNYFYPNSTYSGFNVADAKVTDRDIAAENGVVHVVDRVISSLPSIDQFLTNNPKYSEFKKLIDKFLVQFVFNQAVTNKYKIVSGTSDDVYTKVYNSNMAFSLNNENFLKLQDNDAQADCYSIFVPENAALTKYINEVLLEFYPSIEALPANVIYDFVNAHLWRTAVWPSKFGSSFNGAGEEARFNPATDVTERRMLSNGIFYGTNKVQQANVFSSVYGKAYLNPDYSIMTNLLNLDLKFQISNIRQKYTLFLVSNAAINAAGYFADPTVSNNVNEQWRYIPPGGGAQLTGSSALVRLQRILNMHVIPGRDITSMTSNGVGQSYSGEFIGFGSGKVFASGNNDASNPATVTKSQAAVNGTVHFIDKLLQFSERQINNTSPYWNFYQYLLNSTIYNKTTFEIQQVASGSFYTFFIPDNAAIQTAVNAGLLPGTGTGAVKTPNFNPTALADREKVANFIYYHILNKKNVATDGEESGSFESIYKFPNGDASSIFVNNNTPNAMTLTDMKNRTATINLAQSNKLSNRCTIHLINNYLQYN